MALSLSLLYFGGCFIGSFTLLSTDLLFAFLIQILFTRQTISAFVATRFLLKFREFVERKTMSSSN